MQYFLGYSSFTSEPPFDPSLFVEFRKRLGMDNLNAINDKIVELKTRMESSKSESKPSDSDQQPTNLNLLSDAREKSEQLIDIFYDASLHKNKPRTYRKIARKRYLQTAQKKNKSHKVIRKAVGNQL